ncbi:MAG: helix-turn-helix transcriptional regulator [Proteobacteria bacterium]|nr:helix-turn-helix transcriptional regulator [Pseudomonadota bacterium]
MSDAAASAKGGSSTASDSERSDAVRALVPCCYEAARGELAWSALTERMARAAGASFVLIADGQRVLGSFGAASTRVPSVGRLARESDSSLRRAGYRVDTHEPDPPFALRLIQKADGDSAAAELWRLLPHVARGLALAESDQERERVRDELSRRLADRFPIAVFSLERDAVLGATNPAADELLGRSRLLGLRGGALALGSAPAARWLSEGLASQDRVRFLIAETEDGRETLALCLRYAPSGGYLLLAHAPASPPPVPVEHIRGEYGLTPREARLALGIAAGESVSDLASKFGLSPQTLRTQLKSIFRKTGASSQTDLAIRLLVDPVVIFSHAERGESEDRSEG